MMTDDEKKVLLYCASVCKFVTDGQMRGLRRQVEAMAGNVARSDPKFKEQLSNAQADLRDLERVVSLISPCIERFVVSIPGFKPGKDIIGILEAESPKKVETPADSEPVAEEPVAATDESEVSPAE